MNKYLNHVVLLLGLLGTSWVVAEEECESAVDAAESMNVNQKPCDYSDKGLNGFLQKAFKKSEEGAVLTTADTAQPSGNRVSSNISTAEKLAAESPLYDSTVLSVVVENWAATGAAKQQQLPKLMAVCPQGFQLEGERYIPLSMGRIQLSLIYRCL